MILLLLFAWQKTRKIKTHRTQKRNLSGVECESVHCFWNITWRYVKLGGKLDVLLIQQPHIWGLSLRQRVPVCNNVCAKMFTAELLIFIESHIHNQHI